jgi:hypothetical protein
MGIIQDFSSGTQENWGAKKGNTGGLGGAAANMFTLGAESLGLAPGKDYSVNAGDYSGYYEQAMKDLYNVGNDPASQQMRQRIQGAANDQLAGLADNSAQRKQQLGEDMNRSFAGQTQEIARAKGGTGTLQQALRPSGAMADANARATARSYTDLFSQGVNDLGKIQGVQNSLYGQDLNKANLSSQAQLGQGKVMLGQANTNADNASDARNNQRGLFSSTLGGVGKMFGLG